MSVTLLLQPGIYNSGPGHWQSHWEAADPACLRVQQRDWDHPVCTDWVATLDASLRAVAGPVVLVAHSLGCLTAVHWAARYGQLGSEGLGGSLRGMLLVAVPDPAGPNFPADAQGFDAVPQQPLPVPSIVVMSSDDPYGSVARTRGWAQAWGSELVEIGAKGHINASSGLGDWPQGRALVQRWL